MVNIGDKNPHKLFHLDRVISRLFYFIISFFIWKKNIRYIRYICFVLHK